jgi:hypothetical protein
MHCSINPKYGSTQEAPAECKSKIEVLMENGRRLTRHYERKSRVNAGKAFN